MQRHGWVLLFHECIVEQLQKLRAAARRAERNDPKGFERNANVKLFRALSQLILETVPSDPARDEYLLRKVPALWAAIQSQEDKPCRT